MKYTGHFINQQDDGKPVQVWFVSTPGGLYRKTAAHWGGFRKGSIAASKWVKVDLHHVRDASGRYRIETETEYLARYHAEPATFKGGPRV